MQLFLTDFISHNYVFHAQTIESLIKPHPMKEKANGKEIVTLPLILFSDDVGGNVTKRWCKFGVWTVTFAGLYYQNVNINNIIKSHSGLEMHS